MTHNPNFKKELDFIYSLSNMPRKEYMQDPRQCGWYLKRLQEFLNICGNPERKVPHYIHVTGTSGKGSVTSYLHSILQASGKKVGSNYSPHPTNITERWRVGSKEMTESEFAKIAARLRPLLTEYYRHTKYDMLSFFELTEAIGLSFFAEKKADWVVTEVACGGRYDASNVIPWKDVAVITNIGLDHVGIIGNNKKEIAYEKAGIIKPGVLTCTSETDPKILRVIEKECKLNRAPLVKVGEAKYEIKSVTDTGTVFVYDNTTWQLSATGEHQVKNAILCINVARAIKIKDTDIQAGLLAANQPLRFEVVGKEPLLVLDGAHNEDKITSTVKAVERLKKAGKFDRLHLVLGFSADKALNPILKSLSGLKPATVAATRNTQNMFRRVADPRQIAKVMVKSSPKTQVAVFLDPQTAWEWSIGQAGKKDLVLATGSIFLSGEIRGHI